MPNQPQLRANILNAKEHIFTLCLSLLVGVSTVLPALFLIEIFQQASTTGSINGIPSLVGGLILVALFEAKLRSSRRSYLSKALEKTEDTVHRAFLQHVFNLTPLDRTRLTTQEIQHTVNTSTSCFNSQAVSNLESKYDLATSVCLLVLLACLHPYLVIAPVTGLVALILLFRWKERTKQIDQSPQIIDTLDRQLFTTHSALRKNLIKSTWVDQERLKEITKRILSSERLNKFYQTKTQAATSNTPHVSHIGNLGVASTLVMQGNLEIAVLLAVMLCSARILPPVVAYMQARPHLKFIESRILLLARPTQQQSEQSPLVKPDAESITLEHVTVIEKSTLVVNNLSLRLTPKHHLLIIDQSYLTAAALLRLASGMIKASSGSVSLDDRRIGEFNVNELSSIVRYADPNELNNEAYLTNKLQISKPYSVEKYLRLHSLHQLPTKQLMQYLNPQQRKVLSLLFQLDNVPKFTLLVRPLSDLDIENFDFVQGYLRNLKHETTLIIAERCELGVHLVNSCIKLENGAIKRIKETQLT